jgi:uncharacterized protein (TIGR02996 family)
MSREAFLHELRQSPDDDTTRLVYADWLEDHGEGWLADFIRLAIRLERLPADHPARPGLSARYTDRRLSHAADWLGPVPDSLEDVGLRGGLVSRVTFRHDAAAADIEPVLARHPVHELSISGERSLRELARSPALGLVRSLIVRQGLRKRQARLFDRLLDSPHLGRLDALALAGDTVDNYLARVLVDAAALRTLRVLRLENTLLDDAGVARLLKPGALPALEEWHVECPRATGLGMSRLFRPERAPRWRALRWPALPRCLPDCLSGLARCRGLRRLSVVLPAFCGVEWLDGLDDLEELSLSGWVDLPEAATLAVWPGLARLKVLRIQFPYSVPSWRREEARRTLDLSTYRHPATSVTLP